ncbi:hypothetical protein SAMN05444352_11640 [Pseudomonas japonica]|uniref:Uncharacterized protein n=1 Tax=Pseudomonas japonica TaxID=256466 RepID=A0A239HPT6_9PSED|nr:hypothetical protein SAMN05444352_11640 [Pseudomonas japonica]
MTVGRNNDLAYSILLISPVLLYANMGADPLYTGTWYLLGMPVAMLLPGLILRAPALFLTGTTAAAIASLLVYAKIMLSLARPDVLRCTVDGEVAMTQPTGGLGKHAGSVS